MLTLERPMKFQGVAIPGKFSCLASRYKKQAGDKQKPARPALCQATMCRQFMPFRYSRALLPVPVPTGSHLHYLAHYHNLLLRQHYLPAGFAPTFRTVGPATETSCRAASYPDNGDDAVYLCQVLCRPEFARLRAVFDDCPGFGGSNTAQSLKLLLGSGIDIDGGMNTACEDQWG
jgi:hypothetical protein